MKRTSRVIWSGVVAAIAAILVSALPRPGVDLAIMKQIGATPPMLELVAPVVAVFTAGLLTFTIAFLVLGKRRLGRERVAAQPTD
jgi:hypothetical protein